MNSRKCCSEHGRARNRFPKNVAPSMVGSLILLTTPWTNSAIQTSALRGKKVSFDKVIKMVDDMVTLLCKEQVDDDFKKGTRVRYRLTRLQMTCKGHHLRFGEVHGRHHERDCNYHWWVCSQGLKEFEKDVAEQVDIHKEINITLTIWTLWCERCRTVLSLPFQLAASCCAVFVSIGCLFAIWFPTVHVVVWQSEWFCVCVLHICLLCWAFRTDWCVVLSISGIPKCVVAVVYCLFSIFDSVELFCALLCCTLHTAVPFCDPHTCVQWCAHKFVRVQAECIGWNLRFSCSSTYT